MNVLVTGAAGFIGSHLCDYLLKKNFNVTGVDNFSLGLKGNIEHLESNDNFTFLKMDLTDFDSSLQLYQNKDIDMTFHLAANSDIRKGIESTRTDLDCNLISTYNVLESMKQTGSNKILFSSTSAIYGDVKTEISEDYGPLFPTSLYGASKLGAEAFISSYCTLFGFQSWIIRFPNVIGSRLTHGVIFDFINKLAKDNKTLEILGDGKQKKPYLHVSDLIEALYLSWTKSDDKLNYFNVGPSDETSVDKIAEILLEELGLGDVTLNYTGGSGGWPGDVPKFSYNTSKVRNLGWSPVLTSDQAVRTTIRELIKK